MAVVLKSADKMNKAELVSLVKTLRKRIAKLEGMKAAPPPLHPDGLPVVTHVEPGEDTISELTPQDAEAPHAAHMAVERKAAGRQRRRIDAAKGGTLEPAFPWEKK